ncbi:MBL fold metallo-hydrolase [Bacillus testis]|uniref:MBL fold metallo-hydrolase n=1 Tax=Bacillus testis TaxID=1622072 RepID=UPI00067ECD9C|nr:MBL fold metallo-hydrolase [Bacillus testis]
MTEWNNDLARIAIPTPFAVGDVNAFVLKGDVLTLIDTGIKTPESEEAIKAGLKALGLTMRDIEQIIITHHHVDHVGGVDFFPENIPFLGHTNNNPWLENSEQFTGEYVEFFLALAKEMGVPDNYRSLFGRLKNNLKVHSSRVLTGTLKEGDEIPGHPGWTVLETPGHAESHIVLFREEDGAMFGGDLLLAKVSPNPLIEPPMEEGQSRPKSQLLLNQSLRKIAGLPLGVVYAGHGNPITDPKPLIAKRLQSQHERAMRVYGYLKQQPTTVFEMTKILFPKKYENQFGLTLSETLGQFDYLMDSGLIFGEETPDGTIYHTKQ